MLCFLALPGDFKESSLGNVDLLSVFDMKLEATLQYTVDPDSCQLKCYIVSLAKHQPSTEIYGCYVTVFLRKSQLKWWPSCHCFTVDSTFERICSSKCGCFAIDVAITPEFKCATSFCDRFLHEIIILIDICY